ncbi:FG-GAP-like repeat-containing protein [Microtetraspora niveoalba]|uniref:FG-GAP-like repeat-containing protein n=1 Tax=Microtetraspora niveoalba TaxID=46175 RepID=UPI000836AE9C|nr:FG-GAP-like repeat-containing protein [Microtetraspora niveoalba]
MNLLLGLLVAAATAGCATANTGAGTAPPPATADSATTGSATGGPAARPSPSARTAGGAHDFNGDGYADLAVGAPEGTVNGMKGAGRAEVVYGSAAGVAAANRQFLDRGGAAVKGERFGATLASGDLDGDGYADLVIGAPGKGGRAGSVEIAFGSEQGLSGRLVSLGRPERATGFGAALAVGDFDRDGRADLAAATFTSVWVARGGAGMRTGKTNWRSVIRDIADVGALAAGDVTGEGYADLAVAYSEDDPADEGVGVVYRGSRAGLAGRARGTFPGWGVRAVAVGDLDGDGYGDVVTSSSDDAVDDAGGRISVTRGSAGGLDGTPRFWTSASPGMPGMSEAARSFGSSVAVGDVDGDGYADVAVGASEGYVQLGEGASEGAVAVLYGGRGGLSTKGAQVFDPSSAGVPGEFVRGFGERVALLDLDGDGGDELVVSTLADEQVTVLSPARKAAGKAGAVHLRPERQGEQFGRSLN